jgi:hypothetical protein
MEINMTKQFLSDAEQMRSLMEAVAPNSASANEDTLFDTIQKNMSTHGEKSPLSGSDPYNPTNEYDKWNHELNAIFKEHWEDTDKSQLIDKLKEYISKRPRRLMKLLEYTKQHLPDVFNGIKGLVYEWGLDKKYGSWMPTFAVGTKVRYIRQRGYTPIRGQSTPDLWGQATIVEVPTEEPTGAYPNDKEVYTLATNAGRRNEKRFRMQTGSFQLRY